MVVNLFKPSSGDIFFDKICITKIKHNTEMMKFRKQIQMIFQDPYSSLNGRLKVKDIIAEPIKLHNPSISNHDLNNYYYNLYTEGIHQTCLHYFCKQDIIYLIAYYILSYFDLHINIFTNISNVI